VIHYTLSGSYGAFFVIVNIPIQQSKLQNRGVLAMFGAASIWGTWVLILSFVSLPSIYILPISFTSSSIMMLSVVMYSSRRQAFLEIFKNRKFARLLVWVAVMEVTQTSLYLISYSIAIQDGGSVVIPIIRSLAGVLTPILATFSTNERFSKTYLFYGTLSSIGAILIFSRGGIVVGENLSQIALVMVIISVLIRGWFYLEQRKLAQEMVTNEYEATHVLAAHLVVSAIILTSVAAIYTVFVPQTTGLGNVYQQVAFIAIIGLTHTGFASLLRLVAMKQINAQQSIIIMYIEPFLAVMLSILFLGETVTLGFVMGAILILFSAGRASMYASKSEKSG
jgi:drug/metabolite transporter (DMT)-like permease